ncbi:MAG: hypothetical protein ACHQLQ_04975 [Candidatus Acidiferrales bacterium]
MNQQHDLRLVPDWPRIRQLVAKKLGKSENEVQSMAESGDSLDQVELAMPVEEVLDVRLQR